MFERYIYYGDNNFIKTRFNDLRPLIFTSEIDYRSDIILVRYYYGTQFFRDT